MVNIIPRIFKSKIGKDVQYVVRYSDIESCFLELSVAELYLDIHFSNYSARSVRDRKRAEAEGRYRLISLGYNSGYVRYAHNPPWKDVDNPVVVGVNVDAVPRIILERQGVEREMLRLILAEQVHRLNHSGGIQSS